MQMGPACYSVAPARSISASGPVFPWQNEYEVAYQEENNSPGIDQVVKTSALVGERLFTMEPLGNLTWMELDIQPLATILFGGVTLDVDVDQVAGAIPLLKEWTRAKVRVYYQVTSGQVRTFDADIGTGVVITVPPTNKVEVDLLIPREEGIDEIIATSAAPPVQGAGLRDLKFATTVNCKCTCVSSPSFSPARYTELHYLDNEEESGTDGQLVKLQRYASRVQCLATALTGTPALAVGDVVARYVTALVATGPDALGGLFPNFTIPFLTPNTTEILQIPKPYANAVRVTAPGSAKHVQANVVVSQELHF